MDYYYKKVGVSMQVWKKLGLVFCPNNERPWLYSHAQLPTIDYIVDDIYRVYFASRTKDQRSHTCYVDIEVGDNPRIISYSMNPVLKPGPIGSFDEHGVYPSSILNKDGRKYLYYIGWTQGVKSPLFYASVGLAVSDDNGNSFMKISLAPVFSRNHQDPFLVTAPFVFIKDNTWMMAYVSGIKWEESQNGLKSFYHIKKAISNDGVNWSPTGKVLIDLQQNESNIARTWIVKENTHYSMWYSYVKNAPYKIGYACSHDGENWHRKDDCLTFVDSSMDEQEMMCYPAVFEHKNVQYMLYNGNSYGKFGFYLARRES